MARLLMNLILMQHHLPPAVLRVEKRNEYLFALQEADAGMHSYLIGQIGDEVIRSLETILRGAKGEGIEEPDDIDKEIRLLKQQLQHIEDPVELSEAVQLGLFSESIEPLFRRLGDKLSYFDDFYSNHSVQIQGQGRHGEGAIPFVHPVFKNAKDIASVLTALKSKYGLITNVQLMFNWGDLRKAPMSAVQDSLQISIVFQQLNYLISAPTIPYSLKHVYNAPLEEGETTSFISAICRKLMVPIQQEIKSQASEMN
jgi:hypothetical protein